VVSKAIDAPDIESDESSDEVKTDKQTEQNRTEQNRTEQNEMRDLFCFLGFLVCVLFLTVLMI
jgi:hypothetical protein